MKPKITVLLALVLFALGVGLSPFLNAAVVQSGKGKTHSTLNDRRCEKCRRGDDGKMVCEPVPCP